MSLRRRSTRTKVVGVGVVLALVAGIGIWMLTRSNSAVAQTVTTTVSTGTMQQTVSATGTIEPAREADLDFGVSGTVTAVKVKAGDKVKKGRVLATLDTASLAAARSSAQAQLDAAQTQADSDGSASAAQRAADDAGVASAAADLRQAESDFNEATLRSTISGTVASVSVAVGDQASSGNSGTGNSGSGSAASGSGSAASASTSAVVVISPRRFVLDGAVSASDVKSVKVGLQAQITPSGANNSIFGTVSAVGLVAEVNSSGAATFPVTIAITGVQRGLYAGISADAAIIVKQLNNVLTVPSRALHTSGTSTYVMKVSGGKNMKTTVKVGATYGASTEVTTGLKSGDKVVVATFTPTGTGGTGTNRGGGGLPGGGGFPDGGGFAGGGGFRG